MRLTRDHAPVGAFFALPFADAVLRFAQYAFIR
jgi:hypothetical protein